MTLAMHNYEGTHGRLPPAVVYGEDGKPLYSWRVLILPSIEQDDLYNEFHLDEPWDSPHNIELVPRMPMTYAPPPGKQWKVPPHHTVMHVFVGKGTAFEGPQGLLLADISDGTSNTIFITEAGEPVPWSKPEDIHFDPKGPLPELRLLFNDGFRIGMGDGSTRWISKASISDATLRAAITRNGGETLGADW